eukprot:911171_1
MDDLYRVSLHNDQFDECVRSHLNICPPRVGPKQPDSLALRRFLLASHRRPYNESLSHATHWPVSTRELLKGSKIRKRGATHYDLAKRAFDITSGYRDKPPSRKINPTSPPFEPVAPDMSSIHSSSCPLSKSIVALQRSKSCSQRSKSCSTRSKSCSLSQSCSQRSKSCSLSQSSSSESQSLASSRNIFDDVDTEQFQWQVCSCITTNGLVSRQNAVRFELQLIEKSRRERLRKIIGSREKSDPSESPYPNL